MKRIQVCWAQVPAAIFMCCKHELTLKFLRKIPETGASIRDFENGSRLCGRLGLGEPGDVSWEGLGGDHSQRYPAPAHTSFSVLILAKPFSFVLTG